MKLVLIPLVLTMSISQALADKPDSPGNSGEAKAAEVDLSEVVEKLEDLSGVTDSIRINLGDLKLEIVGVNRAIRGLQVPVSMLSSDAAYLKGREDEVLEVARSLQSIIGTLVAQLEKTDNVVESEEVPVVE